MKILCTTLAFILGLYFLRNNIALSIVISLIYLVYVFVRFNKKWSVAILLVFIGGAVLGNLNLTYTSKDNTYEGFVLETKSNYFIFQSHYERFYVYEDNHNHEIGDYLVISAEPKEFVATTYESQFDFANYLKNKGVTRSLNSSNYVSKFNSPFRIHSWKKNFLNRFDENSRPLVNAVLFNEKDYSANSLENFIDLNLLYLISTSGIYLYLIFKFTSYVFGLHTSEKVAKAVPIILFSPLVIFSFPRISILRIFVIKSANYINTYFLKKRFSYLTLLSSLALFFVIIDYHLAYQEAYYIGFSLSLLGIFYRRGVRSISENKRRVLLSISAYLFLLPITCSSKNELHLLSFPFQLMITPFMVVFLLMTLLTTINIPIHKPINVYSNFLVGISKSLTKLDVSLPIMVNEWFYLIYYVSIVIILYLLESQRLKHLRNVGVALTSFIVVSLTPINIYRNGVYFINVGQGDSILIQNHNKYVLIDTGGNISFDMAEETLIPFFNKIGVRHIDLLVTTHDDYDHAGAAPSLMENFKVYRYLSAREDFPYQVGNIYLENINYYDGDANDSCLVFMLNFMNKKWLLTGDASIESEKSILKSGVDVDCDILKVGHHGSSTSTSDEFLRAASPSEAIISCGAKNKYGHPNQEVIDRLNKYNVKIRRTDVEGTISYVSIFA